MPEIRFCDSCQGSIPLGAPSMEREGKLYYAACWRALFAPVEKPAEHTPIWVPPREYEPPGERVQTIEKTAKRWKLQQAIGATVGIGGAFLVAVDFTAAAIVVAVGLAWFLTARVVAWWCHG